ncbi:hypothetical protein B0A55_05253, partial [Friedmanniomyces simplex]
LRQNLDDNRRRLRSLVGASYRDLLGTAERIIEMEGWAREVEGGLAGVGRMCDGRVVERVGGMRRMRGLGDGRERAGVETKVLMGVLRVALRGLRGGGDALLVGKLVVLARVLHKSVLDSGEAPAIVHELGRKLAALRRKLLAFIERRIQRPAADRTGIARTLCAYALVTSSSAKDVLRHLLQVRLEQIEAEAGTATESAILEVLEVYRETLGDVRALFPRLFAESLSQLGKQAMLQDAQIRSLTELNLDIYETWLAPDVQSFTPWVRHEQLLASEVHEGLVAWSKHVQVCVLGAVTAYLASETDAQPVLSARRKIVSRSLALLGRSGDAGQSYGTEKLRSAFLARLSTFAEDCAHGGRAALEDVAISRGEAASARGGDVWQLASTDFDNNHGALHLRQAVLQRRHCRDERVQAVCHRLDAWVEKLQTFSEIIHRMRSTKWDDDLDFDLDDLEDGDTLLDALVKEDPEQLRSTLRRATEDTIRQMYVWMQNSFDSGGDEAMLVRVLREVQRRQRVLAESISTTVNDGEESTRLIPSLHCKLAETVVGSALQQHARQQKKQVFVPVSLWDGSPSLPVQPSPATFRLLTLLQRAMSDVGSDLWSVDAVGALKAVVGGKLAEQLVGGLLSGGGGSGANTNGHAQEVDPQANGEQDELSHAETTPVINGEGKASDTRRKQHVQFLFDVMYLQRILRRPQAVDGPGGGGGGGGGLQKMAIELAETVELDKTSIERLTKSVNEYWKRTYLLFALLAPPTHAS